LEGLVVNPTNWDREDGEDAGPQAESQSQEQPIATLIDQYRTRRNAWLAEVEHLAHLRDEVRSAGERETLEIITKARQDARSVIAAARRELLLLTEQLRASLGDPGPARAPELPPDTSRQLLFAETSTKGLSVSVVPEKDERPRKLERDDRSADLDSLVSESDPPFSRS